LSTGTRHIVLVGLPGAGKSAVAREIGEQLGYDVIELDDEVERIAGRPIPEIFAGPGEAEFRRLESEATRELLARREPAIVSAGGGWIANARARELVPGGWAILYLRVSPAEATSRLGESARRRPLLAEAGSPAGVRQRLEELADERVLLYERADAVVDTDGVPLTEVAARAVEAVQRLLAGRRER
jgi:shikimate kinase